VAALMIGNCQTLKGASARARTEGGWPSLRDQFLGFRQDDVFPQRILYQFGVRFQAETLHDLIFMKSDRARSEMQRVRRLLHGSAFRPKLQYFTLPVGEFFSSCV